MARALMWASSDRALRHLSEHSGNAAGVVYSAYQIHAEEKK